MEGDRRARSTFARRRTLWLVAIQIGLLCGLVLLDVRGTLDVAIGFPAIGLAPLFVVSGLLVFHLEFREEAHSFNFSELPIVPALFYAAPGDLLVGRLIGEVAALLFHPRQPALKILVNLTNFTMECAVALVVFHAGFGGPSIRTPLGWVAAFAAVLAADLVSVFTIGLVIRWHGGSPDNTRVAVAAIASACGNASLGVITALLLDVHPAALAVLAVVVAVLYLGYRGYSNLAERYASLQFLHEFSEAIGGSLRPSGVIEAMLHHARKLLRGDVAELIVFDDQGTTMRARLAGDDPLVHRTVAPDERKALDAFDQTGVHLQPRGKALPESAAAYADALGCRDFLHVTLETSDVRCALVVGDRLTDVSTFDREDARLFATLANHATMALEKGQLIEKLQVEARRREHQALHDDLTGLPNRAHFNEACAAALEAAPAGEVVGVMLLDLDLFKDINDTLGHQTGDELLIEVGRRVAGRVRKPDLAARLGGDEFAILISAAPTSGDVLAAAARILEAIHTPITIQGLEFDVRASVGVAVAPDHGLDPQALLQRADVAMYNAKRNQTGVEVYRVEDDQHSPRRLQLAGELRRAIEDEDLVAYFQPKADLRTGRIIGVEALVRWPQSSLGPVYPDEFIPAAEQTGLITPLTMLVLRQALSACGAWSAADHDLDIAVNIATRSLLEPGFHADVAGLLARSRIDPARLTLEITESSIMSDTRRALEALEALAELGVKLSVDDFGTGYSSLSYLQRLPVQELKVDKSFVFKVHEDAGSRAIVQSVVDLGHSLGLSVVAEGVENQLAWDHLLNVGCDVGQGYFLSRPIPEAEILEWLNRRDARPAAAPMPALV